MTQPAQNAVVSALSTFMSEKAVLLSEPHFRALLMRVIGAPAPPGKGGEVTRPRAANLLEIVGANNKNQKKIMVIPVIGVLTRYASWFDEYAGMCATIPRQEQLEQGVNDDSVSDIVLDIDSPGGFVTGTVEFADAIALACRIKPVYAVVRGMCCSGAYWLASQCTRIISRRECEVGNIGVYSVLQDWSKFLASIGVDLKLVASGPFKGLTARGFSLQSPSYPLESF